MALIVRIRTTTVTLLVTLSFYLITLSSRGQSVKQTLLFTNDEGLNSQDVLVDARSRDIIRTYSKTASPSAGGRRGSDETGLITSANEKIILPPDEFLVYAGKGYFLTTRPRPDVDHSEILKYTYQGTSYQQVRKVTIPLESSVRALDGGGIIVSDQSEGYGKVFEIYSENLNLISSFTPIPEGFNLAIFNNQGNYVVYALVKSETDTQVTLILQDWKSGRVLAQRSVSTPNCQLMDCTINQGVVMLHAVHNTGAKSRILLYNVKLETLQDKEIAEPVSYHDGVVVDTKTQTFVVATRHHLLGFDLRNGNPRWSKDFTELVTTATGNTGAVETLAFQPALDAKYVGIFLGTYEKSSRQTENSVFYLIDPASGKIATTTSVGTLKRSSGSIRNTAGKTYLSVDGKVYQYEIQ